jgi:hypothetical protein
MGESAVVAVFWDEVRHSYDCFDRRFSEASCFLCSLIGTHSTVHLKRNFARTQRVFSRLLVFLNFFDEVGAKRIDLLSFSDFLLSLVLEPGKLPKPKDFAVPTKQGENSYVSQSAMFSDAVPRSSVACPP